MTTQADAQLREAKKLLDKSVRLVGEIVSGSLEGTKDYNEQYRLRLRRAFAHLLEAQDEIGER